MAEQIDKEIEAIKIVLHALEPLPADVRASVLGYVLQRLQIVLPAATAASTASTAPSIVSATARAFDAEGEQQTLPVHIKALKEQKKPRSAKNVELNIFCGMWTTLICGVEALRGLLFPVRTREDST